MKVDDKKSGNNVIDRNVLNNELDALIVDLEHARSAICKTNHDFIFNFVFNSVNFSMDRLPQLFKHLEKLLGTTQKDERVVSNYKTLMKLFSDEFNAEKESAGYKDDFLRKINKTLKEVCRLRKNFD